MFAGVNCTFFPQHFLGLNGMPRRYPDYPIIIHLFNFLSRWGSTLSLVRLFRFLGILWESLFYQRCLVFPQVAKTEVEWAHRGFPVRHKPRSQNPLCFEGLGIKLKAKLLKIIKKKCK